MELSQIFDKAKAANITDVVSRYIDVKPSGSGYVACCPFHTEKTASLSVSPNKGNDKQGLFHCFGCGESGDAIAFVSKIENVSIVEAAQIVAGEKVSALPKREYKKVEPKALPTTKHIAATELPTQISHIRFGKPELTFTFYTPESKISGIECRFKLPDGGKTFLPYTFRENEKGQTFWAFKGIEGPRPPYNLARIKGASKVMLHEGAKCAEAGAKWLPQIVHTAFMHGSQSAHLVDYSAFADKDVIVFPDNDEAGAKFLQTAARCLENAGAKSVRYVKHTKAMPTQFDIADIGTEKAPHTKDWTTQNVVEYIRNNITDYATKIDIEQIEAEQPTAEKSNLSDLEYILLGAMLREPKDVITNVSAFNHKWLTRSKVGAKHSTIGAALMATLNTIVSSGGGASHYVINHVANASFNTELSEGYLGGAMGNAYDVSLDTALELWRVAYLDYAYFVAAKFAIDGAGYEDRERKRKGVLSEMQVLSVSDSGQSDEPFINAMQQAFSGVVIEHPCRTHLCKMQKNGFKFFEPQTLTVIAARPALGKTMAGLQVLHRDTKAGKKAVLFSLEMSRAQIQKRLFTLETGISHKANFSRFDTKTMDKCKEGLQNVIEAKYSVIDNVRTIEDIEARCVGLAAAGELDIVIIDYIQLVESASIAKGAIREQVVAQISRAMKRISKELNVSVIALAQTGRASEGKVPSLADLRESGAIEADADNVIFLHMDRSELEEKRGINIDALMYVAKCRDGGIGGYTCYYSYTHGFTDNEVYDFQANQQQPPNKSDAVEVLRDDTDLPF